MVGIAKGIAAALTGGMEAVAEEQQARNKALQKKIEKIQASALERSKSKYTAESKDFYERKAKLSPLLDVTDVAQREYDYAIAMDKVKNMEEFKAFKDSGGKYAVSDDDIRAAIGDEPIFSYDETEYDTVRAPSVAKELAGKLGFDVTKDESVASQMAAIEAAQAAKSAQKGATTYPLRQLTSEFKPVGSDKDSDMKAYLKRKYPQASDMEIEDIMYTQKGMKVGPTGIYSTLDEAAAKVMGGNSKLEAEKFRNRQQAEANMKAATDYSMKTPEKDLLMGMIDTSSIIAPDKLSDKAVSGLFANAANMQAALVRSGIAEEIAAQVVVAVHEGAVTEGGLFSKGTFDATKVPQAQQIIKLWKEDGYYQDKDRILNLVYPQMTTEEVAEPAPAVRTTPARGGSAPRMGRNKAQAEEIVPTEKTMIPIEELQVIHKDKIDYYTDKYPNKSVEEIIKQMQKQGVI